jgi:hypothetical protein
MTAKEKQMIDFNPWEVALTQEEASREVAERVEKIQTMFKEAVLIADNFGLRLSFAIDLPEGYEKGHNTGTYAHWSASAAHC